MNQSVIFLLEKSIEFLKNSNLENAELLLNQALKIEPNNPEVLRFLGIVATERKEFSAALKFLKRSLRIYPKNFYTLNNLGNLYLDLLDYSSSLSAFNQALQINPSFDEAWLNKGTVLHELKNYQEAISHFEKALNLNPQYVEALCNKGNSLHALKLFEDAIEVYKHALELSPDYSKIWFNIANSMCELNRHNESLMYYDKALQLNPFDAHFLSNKGNALYELSRLDEAIDHYDRALLLDSNYCEAQFNKGLALLLKGDFENGLPLYENRWKSPTVPRSPKKNSSKAPVWLGVESLEGKSILLYGEQGLGDFIHFCRYAKLVKQLGAKVILEVPKELDELMRNLNGASQLIVKGQKYPSHDFKCPLMSLPLAFNTNSKNIPTDTPYLIADQEKITSWKLKLGEQKKKRIGLVWSSASNFKDDSKRSLQLKEFIKALPLEKFEYICLQKHLNDCDKSLFNSFGHIKFFGNELNNFADTAALIENIDLVISTCTSIPHLSGSLGKETWLLLSKVPDWRWHLDINRSPWYPSHRLFRQSIFYDWNNVLSQIHSELQNF